MKRKSITEFELGVFKKHLFETEKSTSTIQKYVRDICKLKDFSEGKNLTRPMVLRYKRYLEESGKYKISSINLRNPIWILFHVFFVCKPAVKKPDFRDSSRLRSKSPGNDRCRAVKNMVLS